MNVSAVVLPGVGSSRSTSGQAYLGWGGGRFGHALVLGLRVVRGQMAGRG